MHDGPTRSNFSCSIGADKGPKALVMIMNTPWALDRIAGSVTFSTYNERDVEEISYTVDQHRRPASDAASRVSSTQQTNLNTQANMLINITVLMPYRFRKNGMSNIQSVSDICESDMRMLACSTPRFLQIPLCLKWLVR